MSGIVGVEKIPQMQPAADSFAGYDSATADHFLRVVQPPDHYDTLLISDLTFAEWAKVMDFVPKGEVYAQVQRLREEVNATYLTLSNAATELSSVRAALASLEGIEKRLDIIGTSLDSVKSSVGTIEQSSGNSEGSSKSTAKS